MTAPRSVRASSLDGTVSGREARLSSWKAVSARPVALAVSAFLGSLAVLAVPLFFATILFAGPHSDLLPGFLQPAALLGAWTLLFALPLWLAVRVYRRAHRARTTRSDTD